MKKHFFSSIRTVIFKHSSEILTGLGIAGTITALVMVGKAAPKAVILIDEKKKELGKEKLSPLELGQTVWKCYLPAAMTETVSVICIIGANSINTKRNAALATAYSLSETALRTYQDKVVETIGEKKEQEIRDSIAKEQIATIGAIPEQNVISTGHGDTLCFDCITRRYFRSDINFIKKMVNDLNRTMRDEMYVSLNDFYLALGLEEMDPRVGDELGWNIDKGYIDLNYSSQLTDNGVPCLVIGYALAPKYGYKDY